MKKICFIVTAFLLTASLYAQQGARVTGIVLDSTDGSPLIAATIQLHSVRNPDITYAVLTDRQGKFEFGSVMPGPYTILVSFVGFGDYSDTLFVRRRDVTVPEIRLPRVAITIQDVEVVGQVIISEQKGDTLQYNANAYKTNPDASTEDLVTKMPGIQKEDNTIKAQGEDVKRVLVDGKPFFGDDPLASLRNLPADMVDKVQVFDQMSEQSQFTGFDDGNTSKTINIVTRGDRRMGQFGKGFAGFGEQERYQGGVTVNLFGGERRITLLGLANNVNMMNFSPQDLAGLSGGGGGGRGGFGGAGFGGMRGGGGGGGGRGGFGGGSGDAENFLIRGMDGNTTTYSGGMHYTDKWGESIQLTASYFYNRTDNNSIQGISRMYFAAPQGNAAYTERSASSALNNNHRVSLRFEYTIDTANSLLLTPRFYWQSNGPQSSVAGSYLKPDNTLSSITMYQNASSSEAVSFNNELLFRHRFASKGRTASISITTGINPRDIDGTARSRTEYYRGSGTVYDSTDQVSVQSVRSGSYAGNITFTEPSGENGIWQAQLTAAYTRNNSDKQIHPLDGLNGLYDLLDTAQSNTYLNHFLTLNGGVSYRYRTEVANLSAGLAYQRSSLNGDQQFPFPAAAEKTYFHIIPSLRAQFRFSRTENLRINYNASVNAPSVAQLQSALDRSNPLSLRTGNKNLDAEYGHRLNVQYMGTSLETGANFFIMGMVNYTSKDIGDRVFFAQADTLLPIGVFVPRGVQLTYPVNYNHAFTARSFGSYGFPVALLRATVTVLGGYSFSRTPANINGTEYTTKTTAVTSGFMLNSNIGEEAEYRIAYTPSYNRAVNNGTSSYTNTYTLHRANASVFFLLWERFFTRHEVNYYYNAGISAGLKNEYFLWNASLGIKLFANKAGELKVDVMDVLGRNKGLNRTITETYTEDVNTRVLGRYVMVTFTYNLRAFGGN